MFENPIVKLNALCSSCAKMACFLSELVFTLLYAGSSTQNASEQFVWCIQLFAKLRSPSNSELGLYIQTALISVTIQH
jgi:hypothetical protein